MASTDEFIPDLIDLEEEIRRRDDQAESTRRDNYVAARKIQAWMRGIFTRNHLRFLHKSTTIIQRHWRGHRTRVAVDLYLVERVHQMWQNYYDEMATRIQSIWRGYWVRKTVLDIPKMRRWLQNVYSKNYETVENMRKFRSNVIKHREKVMEHESMQWILFILFKLHHLLRTHRRPGVITKIDNTRFTFIEEMMKCFKYRRYGERKKQTCRDCQIDPKPSLLLRGTYYERCEREIREIEKCIEIGTTSILRSQPYEDDDEQRRKLNQIQMASSLHKKYVTDSTCDVKTKEKRENRSCYRKTELDSRVPCRSVDDLYKEIQKMDCHLNDLHLNCPIHKHSSS